MSNYVNSFRTTEKKEKEEEEKHKNAISFACVYESMYFVATQTNNILRIKTDKFAKKELISLLLGAFID